MERRSVRFRREGRWASTQRFLRARNRHGCQLPMKSRQHNPMSYRLRTLLMVIVVANVLLAIGAAQFRQAKSQELAVDWIRSEGGVVTYDWQQNAPPCAVASVPRPSWVPKWIGDAFFQTPVCIDFREVLTFGDDYQRLRLDALKNLPTIKSLTFRRYEPLDLSQLSTLSNLESLNVRGHVAALAPLKSLSKLSEVSLFLDSEVELSPLVDLPALRHLELRSDALADISVLGSLTDLEVLGLHSESVVDASPIAALTRLRALDLSDTRITDIAPIAGLCELELLTLDFTDVSDLAPLSGLPKLQDLSVNATRVSNLRPLYGLSRLRHLYLAGAPVTAHDIQDLQVALPDCRISF